MKKEIWKDMSGYEGKYQVSNLGRIKSLSRKVKSRFGSYQSEELIRKLNIKDDGYVNVDLSKNGDKKYFRVHRLVLLAFNPIENADDLQVNHIDGDKSNNNFKNLEWVTAKENTQHAIDMGNRRPLKGEDNGMSKLTEEKVLKIIKIRKETDRSHSKIAKMFNISRKSVGNILNGVTWSHITGIQKGEC